jgi:cytidine deaminase
MFKRMIKKAKQSICRYKIAAIGFNKKGDLIGYAVNKPRFPKPHGGIHAEMALMAHYSINLSTIIIIRTNKKGKLLAIHPCAKCQKVADNLGIKIRMVK